MKTAVHISYESVRETLRSIGLPRRYCGFQRTAYAVFFAVQDEERLTNLGALIYPLVAKQCHTSIASIESSIRTLINDYWEHTDEDLLWKVFHRDHDEKPTVVQFIEELTNYVLPE
jgi:hypothetical protein